MLLVIDHIGGQCFQVIRRTDSIKNQI